MGVRGPKWPAAYSLARPDDNGLIACVGPGVVVMYMRAHVRVSAGRPLPHPSYAAGSSDGRCEATTPGKRRQGLLAAILCSVALHAAPARAGLHGEIVDYGETTAEQEHPAPRTLDDHSLLPRTVIEGIRYVSHTSSLTAQLCFRFGASVRLVPEAGEELPRQLIVVVTHPRITRPDQASSTRDSFPTPVIQGTAYAGWTFDHLWELQPGDWTVEFTLGGKVLASKAFTVTVPTPGSSACPSTPIS